jgi:hypothetical protein
LLDVVHSIHREVAGRITHHVLLSCIAPLQPVLNPSKDHGI